MDDTTLMLETLRDLLEAQLANHKKHEPTAAILSNALRRLQQRLGLRTKPQSEYTAPNF